MLRHIWSIFARSSSLWVAWIKDNLLKHKSLWSVGIPHNCSWCWRKILKLRDIAKGLLRFEVGNGENIHLWLDSWRPDGILLGKYEYRAVYDAQSNVEAKLSTVICNGDWYWRPARSDASVEIQSKLAEVHFGDGDHLIWTASKKGEFVSSDTWQVLREKKDQIEWWKIIWFPLAIPKHAFILWLAMKNRLVTGVRLLQWGYKGDVNCCFCRNHVESRNHLIFECSFSYRIWRFCMARCRVDNPLIMWDDITQLGCSNWDSKTLK
jgi:hypothetical protein